MTRAAVVVATHDRRSRLARLIAALEAQRVDGHFEAVVVDDGSVDGSWAELRQLAASASIPVRVLRNARPRGPAAARNAGWRATDAPVVAFTDDDCAPAPGWLAALVAAVDDQGADLAQGVTVPDPAQRAAMGAFSRTLEVTGPTGYFQTCNMAYRRVVLERLDGFDEGFRYPTGEDTDLAWRALESGASATFVPGAVVYHDVRPSSFAAHVRDTKRWEGVVLAVRKHPKLREHFHRRWFWKPSHPPALLAGAAVVLAARRRGPWRAASLALALPYLRYRVTVLPLAAGPRRRYALVPLALIADLSEVGVLAAASLRYRTLLL